VAEMKTNQKIQIDDVVGITCDRCKQSFAKDDVEWHECHSIEFVGGYYSVFGDGNTVSIDLCQQCVKETIGSWIRVSTPTRLDDALLGIQQRLSVPALPSRVPCKLLRNRINGSRKWKMQ
jgi:hypothetical protein